MSNQLSTLVQSAQPAFNSALTDESISFEKEAGFAIQALSASEFAMKTAMNNKQSVVDAVTNVAAIGISLNPAKKQAYLVPRDGKVCLDISYMGLMDLAIASGAIKWAKAAVVYEADEFELRGYDEAPVHNFHPFAKDRGDAIGVFCVVKTADNEYITHSMAISEVYAIRDRSSQSFKGGKSSPWKTDEAEMIKKTCVKQAFKYWPKKNPRLEQAIHYLNTEAGEGLAALLPTRRPAAFAAPTNAIDEREREHLIRELETVAENGTEAFITAWRALKEQQKAAIGIPERNRIKSIADSAPKSRAIEGEVIQDAQP